MMYMPHFGCSTKVNACAKKLLVSFYAGFLWLNQKVYVDVELITVITGFPLVGVDPTPFFTGKEKANMMTNKLKDKYDLTTDTVAFFIASINDHIVRLPTKVLYRKLV